MWCSWSQLSNGSYILSHGFRGGLKSRAKTTSQGAGSSYTRVEPTVTEVKPESGVKRVIEGERMDTRRKNTTAGIMFWTPAPARASPTSSVASEAGWEDEEEEEGEVEKEEDFHSQMDENGIIGLKEASEDVELGGNDREGDGEGDPPWYAEALDPEEGSLQGGGGARLAVEEGLCLEEELSYNLSELLDSEPLSHTEPPGEDAHTPSLCESLMMSDLKFSIGL